MEKHNMEELMNYLDFISTYFDTSNNKMDSVIARELKEN